ncbi:hypothetical protein COS18_04510 [Candidatus Falkowbacteria bacterium CG02_land_8_20_14_3_00_36_14]|uniref:Uncharacterized protein n=1 Tax=Candidatus Falkowbacteria bacterium CG02_land_8_20_14_3_00_36_14 TaxID=1974560 RepID=A0A2M7DLF2_9BACT|nr:MAG: hypothetical protein COS18_04510 [Candidatus Falkowbacteria bacterium CG02_land_8_20_14_3_00_36_14]
MLNPTINRKEESYLTLNEGIKKLFQVIYKEQNKDKIKDETPKIKVSSLISKMAFYYEKIRNSVEYKEEHLQLKNAVLRILKRQILIQGSIVKIEPYGISTHLLTELIRAGYLPNNEIPEKKIDDTAKIIARYISLRGYSLANINNGDLNKNDLANWILAMAACEIEEKLDRRKVDQAVISNMYNVLSPNIKLSDDTEYKKDKEIQVYISIHRNYLKFDDDMIDFVFFNYFNAGWEEAGEEEIAKIGSKIERLRNEINWQANHPLAKQLDLITNRYTVFFKVLTETIEEDPAGIYESFRTDPKSFPRNIKKTCNYKYKLAKTKLWRAAIRSIIYILLTKSILVLILEMPVTKWFGEEFNLFSLIINIAFPALLLFLIVLFTKLPNDENNRQIIIGIDEIIFEEKKRRDHFNLKKLVSRGKALGAIFGIIYTITFFLTFGAVIWVLDKIKFNWISIVIFLFFLALVSFFAIRIRKNIRELIVVEQKENILSFFSDFFYVPIVSAGKWISEKFDKVNVFVFILDFIIEAPFKIFVEIAEEWTKYVKERKDEIV